MTGKTHLLGGITASLAVTGFTETEPLVVIGAGMVGALLPDICHSGSKIGKELPVLSRIINFLFGHRTFTHSLLFLVLVSLILDTFFPEDNVKIGMLTGMASHYILDMTTKQGIKFFFPLKITVRFPITIKTGGTAENLVFGILALALLYLGYQMVFDDLRQLF